MPGGCVAIGVAVLAILCMGYFGQKHLPAPKPTFIGLDLGTTFSCVGAYHPISGNVTIFLTDQGTRCIPSVIAVLPENGSVLIGNAALKIAPSIPSANLIYDSKRFIGRDFRSMSDLEFNSMQSRYHFKIVHDWNVIGHILFQVALHNGSLIHLSPEDVAAHILSYLRLTASASLNRDVVRSVLSVPAEFDQSQRNATKQAAIKAGLDVWRIIQEPTAAAMAYGLHEFDGIQMVLVVDLGGGTLDVSLLNRQGGIFITAAIAGNSFLGGQDFTHRLLNYIMTMSNITTVHDGSLNKAEAAKTSFEVNGSFQQQQNSAADKQQINEATVQKLRLLAEEVKLELTTSSYVLVSLDNPVQVNINITRDIFNKVNQDLFVKILRPIEVVLEESGIDRNEVDEIVLVGGSTRVPKVREIIGQYFNRDLTQPSRVDPELAVATGVAVQAGILGGMWPLQVSAVEIPMNVRKIHVL